MFGDKSEQIENLTQANQDLMRQLETARVVGPVATQVSEVVENYRQGGVLPEEAANMAYVQVSSELKDQERAKMAATLKADHYDEYAARFRREEGPKIRADLDSTLASDGTYARIEAEVRQEAEDEVREDLLKQHRAKVDAELDTPEARAAFVDTITPEVVESKRLQEYRKTKCQELETTWRQEVRADLNSSIDQEEAAREGEFKAAYAEEYRKTSRYTDRVRDVRYRTEREWRDRTEEEIAKALPDEELRRLLTEKAEAAKTKLARENRAQQLLEEFESSGIDTRAIEKDSVFTIKLGRMIEAGSVRRDGWGNTQYREPTIENLRTLRLNSLGDGKFMVRTDSFAEAKSPWERSIALQPGMVITLGHNLSENGERQLNPRILADSTLFYDDDTTTPTVFHEMPVPVVDVTLDGVRARAPKEAN